MLTQGAETGIQYRMSGMGRAGYVIFTVSSALFTALLIFSAASSKSFDFLLWFFIAGTTVCTVVFGRGALTDAWRITTHSWGFEAPDRSALSDAWHIATRAYGFEVPRNIVRIPWDNVASYHYWNDDSTQSVVVNFKPGATGQQSLDIDVTNLEPPVEELLRTFDRAIATST
jgi:hypothetical protein